jgi:hypothetical protein
MPDEDIEKETHDQEAVRFTNPFFGSRESFEKLNNWGLAISAGTLLWVVGNFEHAQYHVDIDLNQSNIVKL